MLLRRRAGSARCFARDRDPRELAPLAEPGESCRRMVTALSALARGWERQGGEAGAVVAFESDEVEELRALGYLD